MMTVAKKSWTFYGTLDVNKSTYEDIKRRLEEKDVLWKYVHKDADDREIIILGTTALRAEE